MCVESIDITNIIFNEIKYILDNNEDIKKKYIISNCEDLLDDNKINFYYILLKYILKESNLIYKIKYLIKSEEYIKNLINSNNFVINIFDKKQDLNLKIIIEILYDNLQRL